MSHGKSSNPGSESLPDDIDFDALRRSDELCSLMAAGIASLHGLGTELERLEHGSNILFGLGANAVLKVFRREEAEFRDNEALFLEGLQGCLPVRIPELMVSSEFQGYPYIVMERMQGERLDSLWKDLPAEDRKSVAEQTGALLRALHSQSPSRFGNCVPEWSTFIEGQKSQLIDFHHRNGLSRQRIDEAVAIVAENSPVEEYESTVVCHTEVMPEHMFVSAGNGPPVVTGLIDFEPSMLAVPQYEFCAVGIFLSGGNRALYGSFLNAYQPEFDVSPETVTRMLMLHRYSYLDWFMSTLPDELREADLRTIGRFWYSAV